MSVQAHDNAGSEAPERESRHRYPRRAIFLEYFYAALGLLLTLGPFTVVTPLAPVTGILGALGALFAAFGARAVLRHCTCLRLSESGLTVDSPVRRHLRWDQLTRCALGYYSTKRDRRDGWMQLKLKAQRRSLRIDSQIEGFATIVHRAAHAALSRGIAFDPTTVENLRALGIPDAITDTA